MAGRTHAGPMDFEYQNGTGPMDERSPFAQISMNSQRNNANAHSNVNHNNNNNDKKRRTPGFFERGIFGSSNSGRLTGSTGSFAAFGSPTKASLPSLREPASQPHYFSTSPPKPLPALPPNMRNNPLFSTPRKLDLGDDFASSGGETPKSPERADVDSDATPDMITSRSKFSNLDNVSRPVFTAGGKKDASSPSRRQSWWKGLSNLGSSPRSAKDDSYARGAERKIVKRRNKEKQQALARVSRRDDAVSDSELDEVQIVGSRKVSSSKHDKRLAKDGNDKPHWAFTFFDFITAHPTLPHILSFYAQLLLNLFLIGGVMYIMYSFWSTIRSDVDKKSSEAIAGLLAEMAVCAREYTDNRCERAVPAMQVVCSNWEKCMNQDPRNVGRARVSAHTFAEIFNGFIEPISYKAMIFTVILIFGSVAISNFAFSIFRDKAAAAHANAQHHHYYANNMAPPPPTPQRQFSNGQDGGYWTPYPQGQNLGLEPAPSQYGGQESPVRRLNFH